MLIDKLSPRHLDGLLLHGHELGGHVIGENAPWKGGGAERPDDVAVLN